MIPKIIHYCWFGRNPLPKSAKRCIESWKKFMPDYEIKEWNEDNFDVNIIPFTKEAYSVNKYAYVSDYARLWILYHYGGVYFDTDVEVIRSMDDIIGCGPYMGFEKHETTPESRIMVNPGLGFAVEKGNAIIREIMNYYETHHYILEDGTIQQIPIVPITTEVLKKHGLQVSATPIELENSITIYPWEYFCPIEYPMNRLQLTHNTHTIHHYTESWMSWKDKLVMRKGALANTRLGKWLKRLLKK